MKAVTLYRPKVLENVLSDFDRYMDSFFGENFLTPTERIFSRFEARPPSVDVRETEKSYVLEAELPGYEEKDIAIRLDGNALTIESKRESAEETASKEDGNRNFLIRERRLSSFSRSFRLPENADPEGISASFKNGILSLAINKRAEAQSRVIQITRE